MRITFATYWPLVALVLIPVIWLTRRRTLTDLRRHHLLLSTAVRSLILIVLMFAMMQPIIDRRGDWLSVIYVLDVSQSASAAAIESAIAWIERAKASGRTAHSSYIAFASDAAVFHSVDELKKTQLDRTATNIERALDKALQSFAPYHLKHLVLITDGHQTTGRLEERFPALKKNHIRVYTLPLDARTDRDVRVEAVMAPPDVAAEETFPVHVQVYSQFAATVQVRIGQGSHALGSRMVQLTPGLNRVTFETSLKNQNSPVPITAEVMAREDAFAKTIGSRPQLWFTGGRKFFMWKAILKARTICTVLCRKRDSRSTQYPPIKRLRRSQKSTPMTRSC
jgi:hypothetical protein